MGRVLFRSNNTTNANGGVSNANALNTTSNSNANYGSRLNYQSGRTFFCLLIYRPTPVLDASLGGVPRGTSLTNSSRMAGKVKNHDYRAGLGRRKAEEAGPGERKAMRREKDIMKEVVSYPNIYAAIDEVLRGTLRKSTREGREILEHRDEVIARLQSKLSDGSFEIGGFYEKNIVEAGKERRIQVLTMETRIRELVNLPIVVVNFETGIKTDQGDDRTLVAIEKNGEPFKFFTASIEMRNILEQIKELPDGFPFETTIKAETFGKGKTKYVFS